MIGKMLSITGTVVLNGSDHHHPMDGWSMMGGWWFLWPIIWIAVALIIGILVYRDAEKRGMNGLLWLILVLLPMVGLLFLVIYIVIREEKRVSSEKGIGKSPEKILDERYARGDIPKSEYKEMKKEIRK